MLITGMFCFLYSCWVWSSSCASHIFGGFCYNYHQIQPVVTSTAQCEVRGAYVYEGKNHSCSFVDLNQPSASQAACADYINFKYNVGQKVDMYLNMQTFQCET